MPIGPHASERHEAAEQHEKEIGQLSQKLAVIKEHQQKTQEKFAANSDAAPGESHDSTEAGQDLIKLVASLKTAIELFEKELKELKKNRPPRPHYAFAARDAKEPQDAKIAVGGNPGQLGDEVPRGYLECLSVPSATTPNPQQSGRLELAQWLTRTDNPLTARVMVNRVWHYLFGCGLVKTVDNFGNLGDPPSHPQLLDWLARRFLEDGWSLKKTIRRIVLSRTYQLSSNLKTDPRAPTQPLSDRQITDPENRLLWRMSPRRLEAEEIRDAMLMVSGQLDLSRPIGSTATGLGDQLVRNIGLDKLHPPSRHRSVYLPVIRNYPPKIFELFDFPSSDLVSGRRSVTTTPMQDLYFRNDPRVVELTQAAARRLLAEAGESDGRKINEAAFQAALGRPPTDVELEEVIHYIDQARQALRERKDKNEKDTEIDVEVWAGVFGALFSGAEFRYLVDVD